MRELVDETFQHAAALAAQALAGDQHPLVERRAVTQREALEQVAAVQRGRRLERGQAVGAQRLGTVTVGAGPGRRVSERRRVTPPVVADQLDQRAPGVQMPAVQGPVEHGQRTPERRAGAGTVAVRPQQCRQRFPTLGTLQRDVRSATALRVSTVSGAPSTSIDGGPSTRSDRLAIGGVALGW